ncbi:gastrula zinc finger protein xFG20-1-like [Syngnathoides biaculeatus]|uniref:gastrula zinc finger protein xFG20-1-like n=1 Tax=Syngnathoides biaculeatus TaxID=300417 RepID=UPI002ADE8F65|nr:gastrula zinc finger protein xFG20-1-like [Syngnathoides biaculeatus]
MCKVTMLRELVKLKLNLAVEEIFELFERTIAEYEEANERRHRLLLDAVLKPRVRLQRAGAQLVPEKKEEASADEQEEPPAKKRRNVGTRSMSASKCKATEANEQRGEDLQFKPEGLASVSDTDDNDGDDAKEPLETPEKLKCSGCGETFVRKEDLERHAKTHTGEKSAVVTDPFATKSFICSVCMISFPSRESLISHLRGHTVDKPSPSSSQKVTTQDKGQTGEGVQSQPDHLAPISDIDDTTGNSSDADDSDCAKKPSETNKKLKCSECGETFVHKEDLDRHANTHTGEKPLSSTVVIKPSFTFKYFSCSVCRKTFTSRDSLTKHMNVHPPEKLLASTSSSQQVTTEADGQRGEGLRSQPDILVPKSDLDNKTANSSDSAQKQPSEMNKFKCSACGETFPRKDDLERHAKTHAGEKPLNSGIMTKPLKTFTYFTCSVCRKSFTSDDCLKAHMNVHGTLVSGLASGSSTENVPKAGKDRHTLKIVRARSAEELNSKTDNSGPVPEKDDATSDSSDSDPGDAAKDALETKKRLKCSECGQTFVHKGDLDGHMKTHAGGQPSNGTGVTQLFYTLKSFTCSVCTKSFPSNDSLASHMSVHDGLNASASASSSQHGTIEANGEHCEVLESEPESLFAPISDSDMTSNSSDGEDTNASWETNQSSENKQHHCSQCRKTFTTENDLKNHMVTHTTKPFSCSICDKRYLRKSHLMRHMNGVHGQEKPGKSEAGEGSQADSATEPGKSKAARKRSKDKKPFKCSHCGKRFVLSGFLTRHLAVHNLEKPFACQFCDQKFSFQEALAKHIQQLH